MNNRNCIILNFIKELIRFSNERIEKHNSNIESPRRLVRPITDKELRMVLAILIIGKQEKGTMEFRDWYKNKVIVLEVCALSVKFLVKGIHELVFIA